VLRGGDINLAFRRNFDNSEIAKWDELERELEGFQLSNEEDSMRWVLIPHG
jgi:hypothetical protein